MTVTENNRQEEFGATRTFTVREHAADRLKSQINRNNGQVLNRRRTVGGKGSSAKNGASAVHRDPAPERSAAGIRPASPDAVREIRPVRPVEKIAPEGSVTRARPSEETRPAPERSMPDASAARISKLADAAAKAEEREARDNAILEAKKKPSSVQNKAALASMQMMKTRTSDLGIEEVRRAPVKPAKKEKEPKEKVVSDAGGNTVVSVVKAIVYIIFVVIISVVAAIAIILVSNDVFAFVKSDEVVEITLPEYTTLDELATILYKNDVIKYPKVFKYYAVYKKDDQKYIAGDYTVSPMMNYKSLLAEFKEKEVTGTVRITIPEGYTTDEIIDLLVSRGIGTREGYVDVINNYDFDYWFLDELEENGIPEGRFYRLDGYLFPDTYEFYNASSEEVVIDRLLKRFNQVFVSSYAQKAKELGYTVDQMLIIASLIEKEAGSPAEFFDISSVFNNRLRRPALYPCLESDATIVYAIQHDTGVRVNLTGADLSYDSPYNTYTHQGLPPGPIANPSASAIRAALYPADTDYYYFVAASSTRSLFAKTKEEHEENIRRVMSGKVAEETSAPGLD